MKKNIIAALLVSLSTPALFCILYSLRSLDDSRLVSWADVYSAIKPFSTIWVLLLGQAIAFIFSPYAVSDKMKSPFLFILAFAASLPFWREPEMIVDASRYFTYARHLEIYGARYFLEQWGGAINAWTDMPAVPFFYGIIFRVFGESRVFIHIFNTSLFAGSVVLTYAFARELWDSETGFNAALMLLGIPYIYTQVPLMLVDVPSLFFLMLSAHLFLLSLRRGGFYVLAAGLAIFTAFFTKYSAWLMLTVLPVISAVELFLTRRSGMDRPGLRSLVVFFFSFFLISLLIALKHDGIVKQIHILISYQKPGLARWGESLISTYFFQMHPYIPVMAIISVYAAFRKKDIKYAVIAWLVFIVLILQIRRIRYIIMVMPMLCIMASYGLMQLKDRIPARPVSYSVVAFSLVVSITGFLPFLQKTSAANIMDAGEYLDSLAVGSAQVFTPFPEDYVLNPSVSVPILDLYTHKNLIYEYNADDYPLPEDILTSRLRFTWQYRNPSYYQIAEAAGGRPAVVVISDRNDAESDSVVSRAVRGLEQKKSFMIEDSVFRHTTFVTVYH